MNDEKYLELYLCEDFIKVYDIRGACIPVEHDELDCRDCLYIDDYDPMYQGCWLDQGPRPQMCRRCFHKQRINELVTPNCADQLLPVWSNLSSCTPRRLWPIRWHKRARHDSRIYNSEMYNSGQGQLANTGAVSSIGLLGGEGPGRKE